MYDDSFDQSKKCKEDFLINKKKLKFDNKKTDLLIRKSGTENLIRVMAQSYEKNWVDESIKEIVNVIKKVDE